MHKSTTLHAYLLLFIGSCTASQHERHHHHARRQAITITTEVFSAGIPAETVAIPRSLESAYNELVKEDKPLDVTQDDSALFSSEDDSASYLAFESAYAAAIDRRGVQPDAESEPIPSSTSGSSYDAEYDSATDSDSDSDSDDDDDNSDEGSPPATPFNPTTTSPIPATITSIQASLDRNAAFSAAFKNLGGSWNLPGGQPSATASAPTPVLSRIKSLAMRAVAPSPTLVPGEVDATGSDSGSDDDSDGDDADGDYEDEEDVATIVARDVPTSSIQADAEDAETDVDSESDVDSNTDVDE